MIWNKRLYLRVEKRSPLIQRMANGSPRSNVWNCLTFSVPKSIMTNSKHPISKKNPQLGSAQKCLKDSYSPNLPLIPHLPSRHTVRIPRLANSLARSFMVELRLSFNGRKMIIRRNMKQQTELSWIAPWSKTHTGPSGNALVHSLASSSPNWITHSHLILIFIYSCIPRGAKAKASL